MYARSYGLIRTLAPLHVGASAGEESGNLNLIFRDQYSRTGIIPGSSIRGRFRAEMRQRSGKDCTSWYGSEAGAGRDEISEGRVKFEHASLVWLPVFCPGQPVVWVSSPMLLRRYGAIVGSNLDIPSAYSCSEDLRGRKRKGEQGMTLFFNLGFMDVTPRGDLEKWIPDGMTNDLPGDRLVVVDDADIGLIHDMALYRQSRVKLADEEKKVDGGAFFNVEALPEAAVLIFPIGVRSDRNGAMDGEDATERSGASQWHPFKNHASPGQAASEKLYSSGELYFGGLESIGFGRCNVILKEVG